MWGGKIVVIIPHLIPMETGIQKCEVVCLKLTQYGVCDANPVMD